MERPARATDVVEHAPRLLRDVGVEARRRLVEHEQVGVVEEGAREPRRGLLSEREVAEPGRCQLCQVQQVDRAADRAARRAVERGVDAEVLRDAEPPVHERLGRGEADASERGLRPVVRIEPEEAHRARRRADDAQEHVQRRRLACAVRSEEAEHLTRADVERRAVDGDVLPEALREIAHHDGRLCRSEAKPCVYVRR
jgi:hypothetical protein